MQKITIGFSRPKKYRLFAWLIMKCYSIPYDHVYIKFHSDKYERDLIYQASKMMVNFVGQDVFESENLIIKEFPLLMSNEAYKQFIQFSIDNAGKPYGLLSALGLGIVRLVQLFGKKINNPFKDGYTTYVCCEMAAFVVRDYTQLQLSDDPENISPKELYETLLSLGIK